MEFSCFFLGGGANYQVDFQRKNEPQTGSCLPTLYTALLKTQWNVKTFARFFQVGRPLAKIVAIQSPREF